MILRRTVAGVRRSPMTFPVVSALFLSASVTVAGLTTTESIPHQEGGVPFITLLDDPHGAVERALVRSDGQFHLLITVDPLFERPELLRGSLAERSYRAQRPLLGYAGWALSGGTRPWGAVALFALTVAGGGVLAFGAATLARTLGRSPRWAGLTVLMPGSLILLLAAGPEAFAAGLAMWALARAIAGRSSGSSSCALAVANLLRETMVLATGSTVLVRWRRGDAVRAVVAGAAAVAPLLAWFVVLRCRLGEWPWAAGEGRLAAPLTGALAEAGGWQVGEWGIAVGTVALAAAALVRSGEHRRDVLVVVVPALLFAACMGPLVWEEWHFFARPLLYLNAVCGVVALLSPGSSAADSSLSSPR